MLPLLWLILLRLWARIKKKIKKDNIMKKIAILTSILALAACGGGSAPDAPVVPNEAEMARSSNSVITGMLSVDNESIRTDYVKKALGDDYYSDVSNGTINPSRSAVIRSGSSPDNGKNVSYLLVFYSFDVVTLQSQYVFVIGEGFLNALDGNAQMLNVRNLHNVYLLVNYTLINIILRKYTKIVQNRQTFLLLILDFFTFDE